MGHNDINNDYFIRKNVAQIINKLILKIYEK